MKYLIIFFLGVSISLFITKGFDISPNINNAVQYIKTIFLTEKGNNTSNTGIILEGSGGHGWFQGSLTIASLPEVKVLGTDTEGLLVASSAYDIYEYISGYIKNSSVDTNNYTTGIYFNTGEEKMYLYRTGMSTLVADFGGLYVYNTMTGNWNNASNRIINNSGEALRDRYIHSVSFDSGTKVLTLNVSGYGIVTGYIDISSGSSVDTNNYTTGIYFNTGEERMYLYRTGMSTLVADFGGLYVYNTMTGNWNNASNRIINNSGEALRDRYITGIDFDLGSDILTLYGSGTNIITGYIPNYWSRDTINGYIYPKTITDKIGINTNNPQVNLDVNGRFGVQYGQHINNISNAIDWPYDSGSLVTEKGIYDRTVLSYKGKKFFFGKNVNLGVFEDTGIGTKKNLGRNFILSFYVSDTICGEQFNMSKIYITYWTDLINPGMYTKLVPTNEFADYRPVCINNQNFIRKIEKIDNDTTRYRYHNPSGMPFMGNIGEKIMIRGNEYSGNNGYFTITDLDTDLYRWVEVSNSNSENDEIVEDMYKIGDIFKPLEIESIIDRGSNIWRYNFENGNTVDSTIETGDFIEILYANNSTNNMTGGLQRGWIITAIDQSKTWIEIENFTGTEETNSPAIGILKKKLDIDTRITPNLVDNRIVAEPKTNAEFMANYIISDYTEQNSSFLIDSCSSTPGSDTCWDVFILLNQKYDFIDHNNSNNSIQQQIYYDSNIDMGLPITNFFGGIKNNIRSIGYGCVDNYCPIFANDYTVIASGDPLAQLYLSLPTAIGRAGQVFVIKTTNTLGEGITIKNYGNETIDGTQDFSFLTPYETITVQSDGSNRWKIN